MTPLQKFLKKKAKDGKGLDLDTFGAIMEDFIEQNDCKMLITFPKGSGDPEVRDNMGGGRDLPFTSP